MMTPFWPEVSWPLLMGVVNLTPDSFSDGGRYLEKNVLHQTLQAWSTAPRIFPDFGAESTAPMNQGLTFDQEWQRWQTFFKTVDERGLEKFQALSFDTYRPETMKALLCHPKLKNYQGRKLWNDVSGHFDDQVYELLLSDENLFYVYTHNAVHSRELTPRHREFSALLTPESVLDNVTREFAGVLAELDDELREKVILDPGLGFAKDPETSLALLQNLPELIQGFGPEQIWLIGLSRKSVLQKKSSSKDWAELDRLQKQEISTLLNQCPDNRFIFRVHDPLPLSQTML